MRVRLFLIAALAWLYLALRFVPFLPGGLAVQVPVAIALLLVAEYHEIMAHWFGSFVSPELPRPVLVALGWAFGTLVILVPLLLLRDAAGLAVVALSPRAALAVWTSPWLARVLGLLAAVLAAGGTREGVRIPRVRRVVLTLPELPPAFDGYRITQLSDLHASRLLPAGWIARVVAKANALDADLVVITGDLADGTPTARAADVRPYSNLHAPDGVFAIPGNHEYYADYRGWMDAYARLPLRVLRNEHVMIARGGSRLVIAGLVDRQARTFGEPLPNLDAAIDGVPSGVPVILLDHQPRNARSNAARGIMLQLSGHTHGGQIPLVSRLARRANGGFVSGLYKVGRMQLYVSNGTGLWNGLVLRLGHPSEITELVLHARSTASPDGPAAHGRPRAATAAFRRGFDRLQRPVRPPCPQRVASAPGATTTPCRTGSPVPITGARAICSWPARPSRVYVTL